MVFLTISLLFSFLPYGNAQEGHYPQTTEYGYLLPKYPQSAAKARINADYWIQVEAFRRISIQDPETVKNMKVTHFRICDTAGQSVDNEKELNADFCKSIENAIRKNHGTTQRFRPSFLQ
jgi:hypothetical protein